MARFWKRDTDRSIEHLLRVNRPAPRAGFAASLIRRIESTSTTRPQISAQRFRLALVTTVLLVGIAAALGGISAASAGVGHIVHAATSIVTPAHTDSSSSGAHSFRHKTIKAGSIKINNDSRDDEEGSSGDDQYGVGICHVEGNGSFHLIYVAPAAVPAHLGHGDHYPLNGVC